MISTYLTKRENLWWGFLYFNWTVVIKMPQSIDLEFFTLVRTEGRSDCIVFTKADKHSKIKKLISNIEPS